MHLIIFKRGSKILPENFYPISILLNFEKLKIGKKIYNNSEHMESTEMSTDTKTSILSMKLNVFQNDPIDWVTSNSSP